MTKSDLEKELAVLEFQLENLTDTEKRNQRSGVNIAKQIDKTMKEIEEIKSQLKEVEIV